MEQKKELKFFSKFFFQFTIGFILVSGYHIITSFIFNTNSFERTSFGMDVNFKSINKSEVGSIKIMNNKLNARNVLEIPVSPSLTDALLEYYTKYVEPFLRHGKYSGPLHGIKGHEFYCISPKKWESDIQWISVNNHSTYNFLVKYFDDMHLGEIFRNIIDFDKNIIVYSIFFVIRSRIPKHNWHIDYQNGTNVNAFTFMTPLQQKSVIKLAYIDMDEKKQRYEYKKDVGIAFGENFLHTTDIRISKHQKYEINFCFTFGTDKMEYWPYIKQNVIIQGKHYMHPLYGFSSVLSS